MVSIAVCGLHEVPLFARQGVTDIVSIGAVGQQLPDLSAYPTDLTLHRFEFDDICHVAKADDRNTSPSMAHVERLIALADQFIAAKDANPKVLFHCQAGISRSTAAAFILCVRAGMTYEQAYNHVLAVRGALAPNLLMIKYADILMGQGGKMLDFIAERAPCPEDALGWVIQHGYT